MENDRECMSKEILGGKAIFNPPVFIASAIIILAFVIFGAGFSDLAAEVFDISQSWIVNTFGWFYLLAVAIFLIFCLSLAISPFGQVKLGPDHSSPDYNHMSWFAMLFSAGMGIGLLFYGVAEPIMHYSAPPTGDPETVQAARDAMSITFFHWGLHAWAIYAVVGMSLAYFSFRHNLPLTIRSALYPIIGEKIYGPIGHIVDIFAVIGTMFGVATSLGLGVLQINAGMNYLFDIPESIFVQITIIGVITVMATGSVVAGLDAGIKRLSELNLTLAIVLLLFVLIAGPTLFLFQTLVQNTGTYINELVTRTFNIYAYDPNDWLGSWTLFYWGWWIAWSPFVGMFIARVSRGRTIREFVLGVLFVPVGFTFMWMTFFGGAAISMEMGELTGTIASAVNANVPTALFVLFEQMPFSTLVSGIATVLVVTFFVTSSDSGSLVIDIITSGGHSNPPVWQRIFWAISEGVVAAVLLLAGGLAALQTAAIMGALPFSMIMLVICYGLFKGLRAEGVKRRVMDLHTASPINPARKANWKQRLRNMRARPTRTEVVYFISDLVNNALEKVATELRKSGAEVQIKKESDNIEFKLIHSEGFDNFIYAVYCEGQLMPRFAFSEFNRTMSNDVKFYRAEVHLAEGSQQYDLYGFSEEQIINDVLTQYEKHMYYLQIVKNKS